MFTLCLSRQTEGEGDVCVCFGFKIVFLFFIYNYILLLLFFDYRGCNSRVSRLTEALAEVRVTEIETLAINSCQKPPKLYRHFVDDGFGQSTCKQHADEFLQHLNSLTQDLQYTIEHPSTDCSLPYLDVTIHSDKSTSVYRKPIHTNLYTNYSSAAPSSTKNSIISSLTRRAYTICSPKHLKPELEFLKQTFLGNGYPVSRISLIMQRTKQSLRKKKKPSSKTTRTSNIVIPLPAGRSKDLKRALLPYDITTSFSSPPTLMTLLRAFEGLRRETHFVSGATLFCYCA